MNIYAVVELLIAFNGLIEDKLDPLFDGVDEDLRECSPEDFEFGCHCLDVGPACCSERCNGFAVCLDELDTFFFRGVLANLGFGTYFRSEHFLSLRLVAHHTHPFDDIHSGATYINAGTSQT